MFYVKLNFIAGSLIFSLAFFPSVFRFATPFPLTRQLLDLFIPHNFRINFINLSSNFLCVSLSLGSCGCSPFVVFSYETVVYDNRNAIIIVHRI